MRKNHVQGFLKAKISLLLKMFNAWSMTTHRDLPGEDFMIRSRCENTFSRTPFSFILCKVSDGY